MSGQFGRLSAMSVSTIQFQFSNFSGRSRSPRAMGRIFCFCGLIFKVFPLKLFAENKKSFLTYSCKYSI